MRFLFFIMCIFLIGCKEKVLTPVGQEYVLMDSKIPMEITLGFNPDGRFYGKAINSYWGQYHIHDNVISFSGITSTMKSGTKPQMKAERTYFENLTNGHTFEINKETLKIFFDETDVLEFKLNADQMDFQ